MWYNKSVTTKVFASGLMMNYTKNERECETKRTMENVNSHVTHVYPPNRIGLEEIIKHMDSIYASNDMNMESVETVECDALSTDTCKMHRLFICRNPECGYYGEMKGLFEYKDGRMFLFHWHVHSPNEKAKDSHVNTMKTIEECQFVTDVYANGNTTSYVQQIETDFGANALMRENTIHDLKNVDFDLRLLMFSIRWWTVKKHLCVSFHVTDKQHLEWLERIFGTRNP